MPNKLKNRKKNNQLYSSKKNKNMLYSFISFISFISVIEIRERTKLILLKIFHTS